MRRAALGSALFFLVGPGLEAGVGPFVVTGGWQTGDVPAIVRVIGALVVAGGLTVLVTCFASFARDGAGTPSPAAPARRLVVRGAYRHVRNPIYVATAATIAGEGLLLGRWILLVAAAVYVAALGAWSHWREEPLLRARFGAEYDAYRAAVPAWIPRRRPWVSGEG